MGSMFVCRNEPCCLRSSLLALQWKKLLTIKQQPEHDVLYIQVDSCIQFMHSIVFFAIPCWKVLVGTAGIKKLRAARPVQFYTEVAE